MSHSFCYVILAHTDPAAVHRLLRRVRALSPEAGLVVRSDTADLVDPVVAQETRAHVLDGVVNVEWGDFSQVRMMTEALDFAATCNDAEYFVLISGHDYPIRRLDEWEREFAECGANAQLEPIPPHEHDHSYRWLVVRSPLARGHRVVAAFVNRAGRLTRPLLWTFTSHRAGDRRIWVGLRRVARPPVTVTKCSQWMVLDRTALASIGARRARDRHVERFLRHVKIPDESYLASLVHDDPTLVVRHEPTTAKRFDPGSGSPRWVDEEILPDLAHTRAPFVRKVAADAPAALLELADRLARRDEADLPREPGNAEPAPSWGTTVRARIQPGHRVPHVPRASEVPG